MSIQVILCSRNGEAYLKPQIESILKQTERDLRLLISDDVSSDSTLEIALKYTASEPERVRLISRGTPSGSAARHFFEAVRAYGRDADYVMLSDQDDLWHADKAEKTLAAMKKAEKRYGAATPILVHCDMRVVNADGAEICPSYVQFQKMTPGRTGLNQLLVQNNVTGGAMMMNAALVKLIASRPTPSHAVMHDHWFALLAAAFGKIIFIDEALYDYRQHGSNVLGAAKGSRVREVLDRLGLFRKDGKTKKEMDAHSRSVYTALFDQAAEFASLYGRKLSRKNHRILMNFLSMRKGNRIYKIATILRCGFTFNYLHRTVGECLFM